jgi:hypothetical protein
MDNWDYLRKLKKKPEESVQQLLKALKIFSEFQDNYSSVVTIQNITRLYQSHPSPQLLSTISQALNISDAEVLQLFAKVTA